MAELKLLTFPHPIPFPSSPDPGDGVNRSKFNFFRNSINTNQQRHLYRDNMRGSRNFLSGGGGCPGSTTYFTVYRGCPMVSLHICQGGVSIFFQVGGPNANFYRNPYNHITITCDFPGGEGVWTPYPPPLDPHMDNVAFWHE